MSLRTVVSGSVSGVLLAFAVAPASAQSVQPAKGQSTEQMQKDVAECQSAATQSSGYNPAAPPPVSSAGAPQAGGRARGAAAGAVAVGVGATGGLVGGGPAPHADKRTVRVTLSATDRERFPRPTDNFTDTTSHVPIPRSAGRLLRRVLKLTSAGLARLRCCPLQATPRKLTL